MYHVCLLQWGLPTLTSISHLMTLNGPKGISAPSSPPTRGLAAFGGWLDPFFPNTRFQS